MSTGSSHHTTYSVQKQAMLVTFFVREVCTFVGADDGRFHPHAKSTVLPDTVSWVAITHACFVVAHTMTTAPIWAE